MQRLYGIILAGGKGERFWPLSRAKRPKQLLPIASEKTMLEETADRISYLVNRDKIIVVGTQSIEDSIKKLNIIKNENIWSEPFGKNTALAIGYTAIKLNKISKDSIMLVCPADHSIMTDEEFKNTVEAGYSFAKEGSLVTFGITPTRPEIGYGYIEIGEEIIANRVYKIKSFKEKPNLKTANTYLKKRNTLWNSGIFLWKTESILEAFKEYMPNMYKELELFSQHIGTDNEKNALYSLYKKCEATSIDFGIMEQAKNIVIVRTEFNWDDVGNWNALERIRKIDEKGNIQIGKVVSLNAENNIIYAEEGFVAAIGIEDLVVVRTNDITFVCRKRDINEIKTLLKNIEKDSELKKYL